jgi:hypothetical protein
MYKNNLAITKELKQEICEAVISISENSGDAVM